MTEQPCAVSARPGGPGSYSGRTGLLWCLCSILLVTVAQLALKYAMLGLPPLAFESLPRLWESWEARLPLALLACGLGVYGLSMLCWFLVLRHLPLNYAYPMLSLSYVLVYLAALALPWFDESAGLLKSCGILLILFGVWLIHSDRPE